MGYYNPNKSVRYNRAVTKKIVTASIAKNKALKKNLEAETELNRAKWENLLSELAYLEPVGEREKRAIELYIQWIQGREIEKTSLKKKRS